MDTMFCIFSYGVMGRQALVKHTLWLARLLNKTCSRSSKNSTSSFGLSGTIGHVAPVTIFISILSMGNSSVHRRPILSIEATQLRIFASSISSSETKRASTTSMTRFGSAISIYSRRLTPSSKVSSVGLLPEYATTKHMTSRKHRSALAIKTITMISRE